MQDFVKEGVHGLQHGHIHTCIVHDYTKKYIYTLAHMHTHIYIYAHKHIHTVTHTHTHEHTVTHNHTHMKAR